MSYAYDYFNISKPFEFEWIDNFKKKIRESKLILVGSGITANEYIVLFKKNKIAFEQITAKNFIDNINNNKIKRNNKIFYLFATPSMLHVLKNNANAVGLQHGIDYYSYNNTIRNRLIVDLRTPNAHFENGELVRVLNLISKIPTMAGIDILSSDSMSVANIEQVLAKFRDIFNIKVIIFPLDSRNLDIAHLKSAHIIELNCSTLNFDQRKDSEFVKKLRNILKLDKRVLLLASKELKEVADKYGWEAVYYEKKHPKYYDQLLIALENGTATENIEFKFGDKCLSRRMYPIIDERLRLKTCSLYGNLGKTNHSIEDLEKQEFIKKREILCKRCSDKNLHRMV